MPGRGRGKARQARSRGERLTYSGIPNLLRTAERYQDAKTQNGPIKIILQDGKPGPDAGVDSPFHPHAEDFEGWVGGTESADE